MKVASFNIRKLGQNKVANKTVLRYLIKIVSRYSLILILEVVDKTGKAMRTFLQELNNTRDNQKHPYSMVQSSRLGRDAYKEQFVFLYREDQLRLTDSYQYEDDQAGDEDAFAREPYILRFTCLHTVLSDLVLIPVHTKPEDSEKELDELYDVVNAVRRKWRTDNILILGDFNADGRYVSRTRMRGIRIRSDANYHWLIGDDVDTTANNCNDHTYDRIVLYGQGMLEAIVPNSAKSFNYQEAFNLSSDMALSISDHYPVEVELRKAGPQKRKNCPEPRQKRSLTGPEKKMSLLGPKKKSLKRLKKNNPTEPRKMMMSLAEPTKSPPGSKNKIQKGPEKKRVQEPQKKRRVRPRRSSQAAMKRRKQEK